MEDIRQETKTQTLKKYELWPLEFDFSMGPLIQHYDQNGPNYQVIPHIICDAPVNGWFYTTYNSIMNGF